LNEGRTKGVPRPFRIVLWAVSLSHEFTMDHDKLDERLEEIQKLQKSLKDALKEKYDAAQYGLRLLEEKENLQAKLEESEERLIQLQRELQLTQEKCNEQSELHRKMSRFGFQEEDDLLSNSVSREEQLSNRIKDLEFDVKNTKLKFEQQMSENDKLHQLVQDIQAKYEEVERHRIELKQEIKALKLKETSLLSELDELESENLDLQKNVLALKTSQIEFESLKHEMKRGQEENDLLHAQLEEITRLKRITEKSLEEALESLQIERDQRHNLKKELDNRLAYESVYQFNSIQNEYATAAQSQLINQSVSNDFSSNSHLVPDGPPSMPLNKSGNAAAGDLFSELQSTEVNKFKADIKILEVEKADLQRRLDEAQRGIEAATSEVASKQERISELQSELDVLMRVQQQADAELAEQQVTGTPTAPTTSEESGEEGQLRRALRQADTRYSVALRQIASMKHDLWRYQELEKVKASPELSTEEGLRAEVLKLRTDLETRTADIKTLNMQLCDGAEEANRVGLKAAAVHRQMCKGFSELLRLYMRVCADLKQAPAKQVVELASQAKFTLDAVKETTDESTASDPASDGASEQPLEPVSLDVLTQQLETQDALLRHLRCLLQIFTEKSVHLAKTAQNGSSQDVQELQSEVLSLKGKLMLKREQVTALRNVLKANKATAETALANLKQKYENEKTLVTDTMRSLRSELKVLKEDAATYASIRAMFAQKHDEFITQMDELQQKLNTSEEEKRTLNSLLRLAIQQKLALTQRLEEYDITQEHLNQANYVPHGQLPSPYGPTDGNPVSPHFFSPNMPPPQPPTYPHLSYNNWPQIPSMVPLQCPPHGRYAPPQQPPAGPPPPPGRAAAPPTGTGAPPTLGMFQPQPGLFSPVAVAYNQAVPFSPPAVQAVANRSPMLPAPVTGGSIKPTSSENLRITSVNPSTVRMVQVSALYTYVVIMMVLFEIFGNAIMVMVIPPGGLRPTEVLAGFGDPMHNFVIGFGAVELCCLGR
uniref:Protein bicaudal D n=1 Tax=Schistocephalus solidus TaxID=70667 RepID=A0A183SY14_SCHSO